MAGVLGEDAKEEVFCAHVATVVFFRVKVGFLKREAGVLGKLVHYFCEIILHSRYIIYDEISTVKARVLKPRQFSAKKCPVPWWERGGEGGDYVPKQMAR